MMNRLPIYPRYKLLVQYDVREDLYESYFHYVVGEYIPTLEKLGLHRTWVWHTAYGNYPLRQLEFVVDSWETLQDAMQDSRWHRVEEGLMGYTLRYRRKVVPYREGFQF